MVVIEFRSNSGCRDQFLSKPAPVAGVSTLGSNAIRTGAHRTQ